MKEILHNLAFGGGKLTTANHTSSASASRTHSCSRLPLLVATVLIALFAVQAKATEVTMDFTTSAGLSAMGLSTPSSSNTAIAIGTGKYTQNNVTLTTTNGTTNTRVFYSTKGISLRVYKGGSITLSVPEGATIKSVKFSIYGIENKGCFTTSTGSFSPTGDWSTSITPEWTCDQEKDINSVTFSVAQSSSNSKSPQVQLKGITVTYSVSGKTDTKIQLSETSFAYTTENYTSFTAPTATVVNASTNEKITDATVTYSSDKEDVATVTDNVVSLTGTAGTATITATYSGDDTYNGSSASYTITVTEKSETVISSTVTFDATTDFPEAGKGANYKDDNKFVITKSNVSLNVTGSNNNGYGTAAGTYYGIYKSNTITFTAPEGLFISNIAITTIDDTKYNAGGFTSTDEGYSSKSTSGTWTGLAHSVDLTASEHQVRITKVVITLAAYERNATSSGWGTICLPYAAKAADGTTIYTVDGLTSDGKIQVSSVDDGVLTAGTPYIYKSTSNALFWRTDITSTELTSGLAGDNNLQGVLTSDAGTRTDLANAYIMNGGIWYRVGEGDFSFTAYHAYLTALPSAVASVKANSIAMDIDGATGINAIDNTKQDSTKNIYTLAGQRVSTMAKGGIYIVNGKKVLVK